MDRELQNGREIKKPISPTTRPQTTALFMLRCKQFGFTLGELFDLDQGEVVDMMTESGNDKYDWPKKAQQSDFDSAFH